MDYKKIDDLRNYTIDQLESANFDINYAEEKMRQYRKERNILLGVGVAGGAFMAIQIHKLSELLFNSEMQNRGLTNSLKVAQDIMRYHDARNEGENDKLREENRKLRESMKKNMNESANPDSNKESATKAIMNMLLEITRDAANDKVNFIKSAFSEIAKVK